MIVLSIPLKQAIPTEYFNIQLKTLLNLSGIKSSKAIFPYSTLHSQYSILDIMYIIHVSVSDSSKTKPDI